MARIVSLYFDFFAMVVFFPLSAPHCTKKYRPFFQLAISTAFVLSARATTRATSASAFAPVTPRAPTAAFVGHNKTPYHRPCVLWRRRTCSNQASKMMSAILESPSAERNKRPIYDQILAPTVFPRLVNAANNGGRNKVNVLELAAGCGVHTTHFVNSFLSSNKDLGIEWHPSDPDAEARTSIDARVQQAQLEKSVLTANSWILGTTGGTACGDPNRDRGDSGLSQSGNGGNVADYEEHHDFFNLVLCINMIHIAPWEATLGLMECAGKVLRKGGMLVCYGPYKVGGTAVESNLKFDKSLQSRDSQWGVRNLEDVMDVAEKQGLSFVQSIEMPANNLGVLFCKT